MKKLLIMFALLFTLMPAVQAEGEEVPAGTTPDSIFYFIDKAIESLDLALTFNDEAKVEKLIAYAEERLAEAEEMTEEQKEEYIEELILEYLEMLEEASDEMMDLDEEAAEELETELDEAITNSDELADKLPLDLYEKLESKKGAAYIKFSVLKDSLGENSEEIINLANENDLGLGELAKIAAGAQMLEQDFLETLQAVIEAGGVEEYFAQFDIQVSDLVTKGIEMKQDRLQRRLQEAIESGNAKRAAQVEFQMAQSVAMDEFKQAKDEIKEKREAILVEYGVEDLDELPDEVREALQEDLKELRTEALAEKKAAVAIRKEALREAIEEVKEAKEKNENGNGNGNTDEVEKCYEKVRDQVRGNPNKGKNK